MQSSTQTGTPTPEKSTQPPSGEVGEGVKELEEKLAKLLELMKPELECIELRTIHWLDDYNGREPARQKIFGVRASDEVNKAVTKILNEVGEGGKAYVYFTVEGIIIQRSEAQYNQFGRWVGTSEWWLTLDELVTKLKEKKQLASVEKVKKVCSEQLSKLG
jgi:hypothetical protein